MAELQTRHLGTTGLIVSCLGLGTVKIGRNQGVKYPADFNLPDDDAVVDLLYRARELGINLIDTAPAYGTSEERLGRLLPDRSSWVLCSKVGEEFQNGVSTFDFSARHTRFSVERSLRRLNTDYLDLVLVHSDGNDLNIIQESDCLQELDRLKQAGLIRATGMSTKTVEGGMLAAQSTDVVMVTFNPIERQDVDVIDSAVRLGKGILVKKGLASGHFAKINDAQDTDPGSSLRKSLEFVLNQQGVSSIIVGTINPDHLTENVNIASEVLARV